MIRALAYTLVFWACLAVYAAACSLRRLRDQRAGYRQPRVLHRQVQSVRIHEQGNAR